jgi:hypothetical protein
MALDFLQQRKCSILYTVSDSERALIEMTLTLSNEVAAVVTDHVDDGITLCDTAKTLRAMLQAARKGVVNIFKQSLRFNLKCRANEVDLPSGCSENEMVIKVFFF